LILAPESCQGPPGGQPPGLRVGRAEDTEQLPGAGPAELRDGLDLLRRDIRLLEPRHGLARPPGPEEPPTATEEADRGPADPARRLGGAQPAPPRTPLPALIAASRPARPLAGTTGLDRGPGSSQGRVRLVPLAHRGLGGGLREIKAAAADRPAGRA